jgi:hypothetical protein
MKRFFVHTGIFPSDPCKIVWHEPELIDQKSGLALSSILKSFPISYRDMGEAVARADELNALGVTPDQLMTCYAEALAGREGKPEAESVWQRVRAASRVRPFPPQERGR